MASFGGRGGQHGARNPNQPIPLVYYKTSEYPGMDDETRMDYSKLQADDISWDTWKRISELVPGLHTINPSFDYSDEVARLRIMHYVDAYAIALRDITKDQGEKFVLEEAVHFEQSVMRYLATKVGFQFGYTFERYYSEYRFWRRYCVFAGVVLVRKNPTDAGHWEALLVKNHNENFCHPDWTWPGGRVHFTDNTVLDAAKRKIKEEVNFSISDDQLHNFIGLIKDDQGFSFIFQCEYNDPRLLQLKAQDGKILELRWRNLSLGFSGVSLAISKRERMEREIKGRPFDPSLYTDNPSVMYMPYKLIGVEGKVKHGDYLPTFIQLVQLSQSNFPASSSTPEELQRIFNLTPMQAWEERKVVLQTTFPKRADGGSKYKQKYNHRAGSSSSRRGGPRTK